VSSTEPPALGLRPRPEPPGNRRPEPPGNSRPEPPALGLRPRPELPPDVLAAIAAAVESLHVRRAPPPGAGGPAGQEREKLRWRFSGRWWALPTVARRDRPW
jgi:hypothetical protein